MQSLTGLHTAPFAVRDEVLVQQRPCKQPKLSSVAHLGSTQAFTGHVPACLQNPCHRRGRLQVSYAAADGPDGLCVTFKSSRLIRLLLLQVTAAIKVSKNKGIVCSKTLVAAAGKEELVQKMCKEVTLVGSSTLWSNSLKQ